MSTLFEKVTGTYIEDTNGVLYPNLIINEEEAHYGKYGLMRKNYLREFRKGTYNVLVLSGKLTQHLNQIDDDARARVDILISQMIIQRNITENLKERNNLEWTWQMNQIKDIAEEIALRELVLK